ncbi:CU044_5270 family protein [Streptomyces sp. CBMA29]|uniref:CU044_5270 family protein n=1 Tax=Streptomyces sp. CBMA29 TaxID=1896314 RepID=UPI001661A87B|nr:CU044_5270 family protein [Streptomyces sp. CBMA29]MBD0738530.1 hypothetical protein [Streptomyces sp. CBMA29]
MDELTKLRDFRADTAAPDAEWVAVGARHLISQIRDTAPPAGRRNSGVGVGVLRMAVATGVRRACVAGLTAGAVTAGVLVALPMVDPGGQSEPTSTVSFAQVLDAAATHAAAKSGTEPSAHQWLYTREYLCATTCTTNEDWLRYDGNQLAFLTGKAKDAQVLVNDYGPGGRFVRGPNGRPQETRARLAKLPREPHALLKALRDDPYFASFYTKLGTIPASSPIAAFDRVVALLSLSETAPPDLTAALYRSLAHIPGVHLLTKPMKDAAGRPGIAVEATFVQGKYTSRSYLILDPKTYAYRGDREDGHQSDHGAPKQGANWSRSAARLGSAVVNHPGQRPGGPVPPPSSITERDFTFKGPKN